MGVLKNLDLDNGTITSFDLYDIYNLTLKEDYKLFEYRNRYS
jgi:hypothetical protein